MKTEATRRKRTRPLRGRARCRSHHQLRASAPTHRNAHAKFRSVSTVFTFYRLIPPAVRTPERFDKDKNRMFTQELTQTESLFHDIHKSDVPMSGSGYLRLWPFS